MKKAEQSFEYAAKVAELEAVLAELQSGEVALDEAIILHEKGKVLANELMTYLDTAEMTIRKHLSDTTAA